MNNNLFSGLITFIKEKVVVTAACGHRTRLTGRVTFSENNEIKAKTIELDFKPALCIKCEEKKLNNL